MFPTTLMVGKSSLAVATPLKRAVDSKARDFENFILSIENLQGERTKGHKKQNCRGSRRNKGGEKDTDTVNVKNDKKKEERRLIYRHETRVEEFK